MSAIDGLLAELRDAFEPLILAATDPWMFEQLLAQLAVDATALGDGSLITQLASVGQAVQELQTLIAQPPATLAAIGTAVDATSRLADAARALQHGVPAGSEVFAGDLVQLVLLRHLARRWPLAFQLAVAAGVIDLQLSHDLPIATRRMPVYTVEWARIAEFFRDPWTALRGDFPAHPLATAADANQTMDVAVGRFGGLATALGIPWRYGYGPADAATLAPLGAALDHAVMIVAPRAWTGDDAQFGVAISLSAADEDDLGIVLVPYGALAAEKDLTAWHVSLTATAQLQAVAFGGGQGFQLLADGGAIDAGLQLALTQIPDPDSKPYVIGGTTGTRLEVTGAAAHANLSLSPSGHAVDLGFRVQQAVFVLTADGADAFVGGAVGNRELRTTIALGIAYTTAGGLQLERGSGLTAQFPVALSVGPLSLQAVALTLAPTPQAIDLALTAVIGIALGPIAVTVHGLGVRAGATFPQDAPPQPFAVDYAFCPPDGAGISIDAPVISGGGYFQYAAGSYSGALALSAAGIALGAYGILDTRPPGGGYSLAAVVEAQFQAIQLGLGFTLNGVGGLIAVNRRVDTDALRAALQRTGIDDLFFPANPVAQAARLIGDLGTYFPEAKGRYVFGPAVKLGWGTPTLLTAEIAVLLEVPDPVRLVVLGSVTTALPTKDRPLVSLNAQVVGELDFTKKALAIDASLVDSKVVSFPITGDFALRLAWGDPSSFVVSVGGFHSQFTPPPGFPTLRRVRIPISASSDPRLDVVGFLAVTSNTAQVGAQVELYASAGPLSLTGSVGFEALFVFSPFSFEVDLSAGVALKRGSSTLAGVQLDGKLSGPTPWHISGEACLSLWFVDLCVDFSATFGAAQAVELPQVAIWPQLQAALQDPANWSAQLPAGAARAVTTAPAVDEQAAVRMDPVGALAVRQRVAPLDRPITRFAQGAPSGPNQFHIGTATLGTGSAASAPLTDDFAPAQFEDLSVADKLSRPGYEAMVSGAALESDAVAAGAAQISPTSYDDVIVVNGAVQPPPPTPPPRYRPTLVAQLLGASLSAVATAPLRTAAGGAFARPSLLAPGGLSADHFVIADAATLAPRTDLPAGPRGAVELALAAHLAVNAGDAGALVVLPAFELAA